MVRSQGSNGHIWQLEGLTSGRRGWSCHGWRRGLEGVGGLEMNDLASWVGASLVAGVFWGIGHVVGNATAVEPVSLSLISLEYRDGKFTQRHKVTGTDILDANWTAQITRGDKPLCGGGGKAPYGGVSGMAMTPDEWTGDVCPEVLPGDRAVVVWSWVGSDDVRRRISGELIISE